MSLGKAVVMNVMLDKFAMMIPSVHAFKALLINLEHAASQ